MISLPLAVGKQAAEMQWHQQRQVNGPTRCQAFSEPVNSLVLPLPRWEPLSKHVKPLQLSVCHVNPSAGIDVVDYPGAIHPSFNNRDLGLLGVKLYPDTPSVRLTSTHNLNHQAV